MYTGFNGERWFDAQDAISKQWVVESIPEGETFTLRFRADKEEFNTEDLQALFDLHISFRDVNRSLAVVYCASVRKDATIVKSELDWVINSGVNVVAVEFGNEVYSAQHADFNFELYKEWFTPLEILVHDSYPTMPCLVFLAPRPNESGVLGGRSDNSAFNNPAIEYINSKEYLFPVVHIYFNNKECPEPRPVKRLYSPDVFYNDLDIFYTNISEQAFSNFSLWDKTLSYLASTLPTKRVYITEWGFDNYGDIKNTLALGNVAWKIWNTYGKSEQIEVLLQHNGISMAGPGMIFPTHSTNDIPSEGKNKRRVDYWVWKLYRSLSNTEQVREGVFQIPFSVGETPYFQYDDTEYELISTNSALIEGDKIYSSAGATEWMEKNSTPTYEISGTTDLPSKEYYFGYVELLFKKKVVNIPPTVDAGSDKTIYTHESVTLSPIVSADVTSYVWCDANDIILSTQPTFNFKSTRPGVYPIFLTVRDEEGLMAEDSVVITVRRKKRFNFPWLKSINIGKPKL